MNRESCIQTIELLRQLALNIYGVIDVIDDRNCNDIINLLKEQEEDKPKGHWMPYEPDKRGYTDGFTCSRCERVILSDHYCKMIDFDYCPYCGAYMDNAEGR